MVELERKSAIGGDRVTVSQHSEAAASTPHTHTEWTDTRNEDRLCKDRTRHEKGEKRQDDRVRMIMMVVDERLGWTVVT